MESGKSSRRVPVGVAGAGLIAWFAITVSVILYPFDYYWAGSFHSRPGPFRWLFLAGGLLPSICLIVSLARDEHADSPRLTGRGRVLLRTGLPVLTALVCLLLPSGDGGYPMADEIHMPQEGVPINDASPGAELLAYVVLLVGNGIGAPWLLLRLVLAALGALWSLGCVLLFERAFDRGIVVVTMSFGFSFSLALAQYAGYFEPSGFVTAFLPWLFLLTLSEKPASFSVRFPLFCLVLGFLCAFHGVILMLTPMAALALAAGPLNLSEEGDFRLDGKQLLKALSMLGATSIVMLFLSWIFRVSWNRTASFLPTDVGRVGGLPFSPMTRSVLENDTGAYYMFMDRYWLWERIQFLALPGPALLILLLLGGAFLRKARLAPLWFAGVPGCLAVYLLWNYDYGMLRDWNLLLPAVSGILFCLVLTARGFLERLTAGSLISLATMLAAPGIITTIHNSSYWAKYGIPDYDRWSARVTEGRAFLAFNTDTPDVKWNWVRAPGSVTATGPGLLAVQIDKYGRTPCAIGSVRLRDDKNIVGPHHVADLPLSTFEPEPEDEYTLQSDGLWSLHQTAGGPVRLYANASRGEDVKPLEFVFEVTRPGTYSVEIFTIGKRPGVPMQFAPILLVDTEWLPNDS